MAQNSMKNIIKSKFTRSLSLKFIASMVGIFFVIAIGIVIVLQIILNNNISEIQKRKIERIGKLVSSASQSAIVSYDFDLLEKYAQEIRNDVEIVDISFIDTEGKRLNSTKHPDSIYAADKEFGKSEVEASEKMELNFPILSDGNEIAKLKIIYHSLETEKRISSVVFGVNSLLLVGSALLLLIIWLLNNKLIIKPLKNIELLSEELIKGNVEIAIDADRNDEIGSLQKVFGVIVSVIKKQSQIVEEISSGNLDVDIPIRSEKDILSLGLQKVIKSLKALVEELSKLTEEAVNGNLRYRGNTEYFEGGYKKIISGINATLDAIILPIEEGTNVLSLMAQKDFSVRVESSYLGDHKKMIDNINEVSNTLNEAFSELNVAINETYNATTQISSSTEEMAGGAQEQSAQASEVAAAVEEMTNTIIETTRNSSFASEASLEAGKKAKEGGFVVKETIEGMNRIADVVRDSAMIVQELGKSSNQIGEIVQVINDIADQTNLLALNAAIEAARAGEQGRGFAIVADEVRKLAERTTKATNEIADMIKKIQKDTEASVKSMQIGTIEVEAGKKLAEKAGHALNEIIDGSEHVVDMITQVATASQQQSLTSEQISKSIESISNVTAESASGIQQIAIASEDLNRLTSNLQEFIVQFKLSKNENTQFKQFKKNNYLR